MFPVDIVQTSQLPARLLPYAHFSWSPARPSPAVSSLCLPPQRPPPAGASGGTQDASFSDKMKKSLTNTGTLFDIFSNKSTSAIQGIVKEFDSLNFTVEQTQSLVEALGSENIQKMSDYIEKAKDEAGELWN